MSSKFAKSFLTSTITTFYAEVENFTKSKNIEIPPVAEFLQFIEFEAEAKKSKRSTAAPTRGKVDSAGDSKESKETEEKCTFVGSRGGKCKSVAKKDYNGFCKKHFEQTAAGASESAASSERVQTEKKSRSKTTVKTGKGLSSVVSKALEDSDREDEPEVKVQDRRTKPIDTEDSDKETEDKKASEKKKESKKKDSEKEEKKSTRKSKKDKDSEKSEKKSTRKSKKESEHKTTEEKKETKASYVPITFNRDSTSFVYDENADDGFVYKKGEYDTVFAVRHRGVAVKPTRVHAEEIKKAGKSVGTLEESDS